MPCELERAQAGPVFEQPWQAQAFALTLELAARGYFTWKEWVGVLAEEIKQAGNSAASLLPCAYYEHWLAALERLVMSKGLSDRESLLRCKQAWAVAYQSTPHGVPVMLNAMHPR